MKLPMMLRTTTQRSLLHTSALRSIPARTAVAGLGAGRTIPQAKVVASTSAFTRSIPAAWSRSFSSSKSVAHPTTKYTASPLTDGEYQKLSNQVLDSLTETFETLLEDADVETLEQEARAKNQGAIRGSPASEWDIECAVSLPLAGSVGLSRRGSVRLHQIITY